MMTIKNDIANLNDQPTNHAQDDNFKLQTSNFELSRHRRLTGKVASLPRHVRDIVNTMLDDGHPYEAIVAKLTELGHPGFLTQNISRWKLNGYEQYLRRQERADDFKLRTESTLDLLHHFGVPPQSPIFNFQSSTSNSGEMNAPERVRTPTNGNSSLPSDQLPFTNFQLPITNPSEPARTSTNDSPLRTPHSALHHATETLLTLQLFETLLETAQCDLPLEQKAKLLYQLGRLVTATTRERTRRDAQNLDTRKYDDHRADLQPPPPTKPRSDDDPLTHDQTKSIVHRVDQLFGIKLKLPPSGATPSSVPSVPEVPLVSSATTANTPEPVNLPESAQSPITNLPPPPPAHPPIHQSTNPNAVGEWPQPPGTIAVVNSLGSIVGWAAHPEVPHAPDLTLCDPAANKAEPIQSHGKTIFWYDRGAQVRNCPTKYPIPGRPHFIPVIDSEGTVIDWREWDDEWFQDLPPQNPRPFLSGGFRGQIIAWINDSPPR